jgi:hypothetical protein
MKSFAFAFVTTKVRWDTFASDKEFHKLKHDDVYHVS